MNFPTMEKEAWMKGNYESEFEMTFFRIDYTLDFKRILIGRLRYFELLLYKMYYFEFSHIKTGDVVVETKKNQKKECLRKRFVLFALLS